MAINIIKHGEKKFKVTCPVCGCVFEYEYEDLISMYNLIKQVKCPDCGELINHKEYRDQKEIIWEKLTPEQIRDRMFYVDYKNPNVIWSESTWPDCETCPNRPDPNKVVVGDTPCTWCRKNQPYCTTNTTDTSSNLKIDGNVDQDIDWSKIGINTNTVSYTKWDNKDEK